MSSASVVLVHGAHFSGWCWLPVIERLAAKGIDSLAVELPFTSFDDDVSYLRAAISKQRAKGRVSLVSTSYSGITAAAAGHDADHFVFVAARMPLAGESQAALSATWGNPAFRACMQTDDEGVARLSSEASEFLFNQTPKPLADLAMSYRREMRSGIPAEPINEPAWIGKPTSYVVCLHDQAVRLDRQRERAALATWSTEIDADHSPFFSAPDALTEFIALTHEKACRL